MGVQLTLLQPGGADYAHHITASPTGFENPAASLIIVTFNSCFLGMCRSQENPSIVVNKGEILHLLPDHPDRLDDVSPIPEFKPAVKPQLFILEDTPYISVVQSVLQRPKLERPSSRYD